MGWIFQPEPTMVTADNALKGGRHPVLESPQPHAVLGTPITGPWEEGQKSVLFGLGCFWGAEKLLWNTPGVVSTSVGYAGGYTRNPTYREVCTGRTGHTEVVEVVYNPAEVSLEQLIKVMLEAHDPTQGYRQGNDVGTQYRSAIYVADDAELDLAERLVAEFGAQLAASGYQPITTEVAKLEDAGCGEYFLAEDYHQQYLHKNPDGYCPVHATGVCFTS